MTPTEIILLKEYENLEYVFGKKFMDILFHGLSGYIEVRETSTFFEVRSELMSLMNQLK